MPNWDDHAADWDQDRQVRHYADQAFASLIKHVDVRDKRWREKRVLDFGCGTGLLSERLAPFVSAVIGLDTSEQMIRILRDKRVENVTAICADIDQAHSSADWFSDFDLIVASSVCGFLPDYEATVGILARSLREDGCFAQWDWLSSDGDDDGMTPDRVTGAMRSARLDRVHVETAFSVTIDGETMPVLMGLGQAVQMTGTHNDQ